MELVVTLAIIAVIAAVIIPEMRGTRDAAVLRASGRRLLSAASLAYSQAVVRNQTHRVTVDPTAGRFMIEREGKSGSTGRAVGFTLASDLPGGGRIDMGSRVSAEFRPLPTEEDGADPFTTGSAPSSGGPPALVFHSDGTADAAEVLLRDATGFRLRFRLDPVTARLQPLDLNQP